MNRPLRLHTTLQEVLDGVVPALADYAIVHMKQEEGGVREVAAAHRDPDLELLLLRILHRVRDRIVDGAHPVGRALSDGEARRIEGPAAARITVDLADEPRRVQELRAFVPHSFVTLPLRSDDEVFGVLSLARSETKVRYTDRDLRFLRAVAHQAALAIQNASLVEKMAPGPSGEWRAAGRSAVDDATVDDPAVDESAVDEPDGDESAVDEPAVDEPDGEAPDVQEQPTAEPHLDDEDPAAQSGETSEGDAEPESSQARPIVLVVDRDEGDTERAVTLLREAGCEVVRAADRREALRLWKSSSDDIAVVVLEADREALGLVEQLRTFRPELPVVFTSRALGVEGALAGVAGPNTLFLRRPHVHERLVPAVERFLEVPTRA